MRTNIYSIVFLAITVSSTLGATVNRRLLDNLSETTNNLGELLSSSDDSSEGALSTLGRRLLDSLDDPTDALGGLAASSPIGAVEPVRRQGISSFSDPMEVIQEFLPSSGLSKRANDCGGGCPDSSDGSDGSDSFNDSSSPTTNNAATNAVSSTDSNNNNNYFGNVDSSSSMDATNYAPSTDSHDQTDNHPQVPVVANSNCRASCLYNDGNGVLREAGTNGCPAQVQTGYTSCNVGTSSSTINGDLADCGDINMSQNSQTQLNTCSVQPSNSISFINIMAFDCSQNGLLSVFGKK